MTDRELLELAAKAAGYTIESFITDGGCWAYVTGSLSNADGEPLIFNWNPLTDDGGALRLAVKLNLAIQPLPGGALAVEVSHGYVCAREAYRDNRYAATRRAIVRAAAEMGKAMP